MLRHCSIWVWKLCKRDKTVVEVGNRPSTRWWSCCPLFTSQCSGSLKGNGDDVHVWTYEREDINSPTPLRPATAGCENTPMPSRGGLTCVGKRLMSVWKQSWVVGLQRWNSCWGLLLSHHWKWETIHIKMKPQVILVFLEENYTFNVKEPSLGWL